MKIEEACDVLTQRRDYLKGRIVAKKGVNWEHQYDERERDALTCVLEHLNPDKERKE